ncbi:MAG: DUF1801 domain-containing protein [Poseidonia sp.]
MKEDVLAYLDALEPERRAVMERLMNVIRSNLPDGFEEVMQYGMPSWVVPHDLFPDGYHVDPSLPLPFLSLGSQKRHIGLYHMGIYADEALLEWFTQEYPKHCSTKLDMGKSCIRFKNMAKIPDELVAELCTKMTPEDWIQRYRDARA